MLNQVDADCNSKNSLSNTESDITSSFSSTTSCTINESTLDISDSDESNVSTSNEGTSPSSVSGDSNREDTDNEDTQEQANENDIIVKTICDITGGTLMYPGSPISLVFACILITTFVMKHNITKST